MESSTNRTSEAVIPGGRFAFGDNWRHFLNVLNDARIAEAQRSLVHMLETDDLHGRRFLDIGSGSGLFSLAARQLGAKVHSFDYDPQAAACTQELKRRYFPDDPDWTVEVGSVLDVAYLRGLGRFDVVYSWGVLHHTGQMWQALDNVCMTVAPGGLLFISIYNDQGRMSRVWRWVKKTYNRLPRFLRLPFVVAIMTPYEVRSLACALLTLRPARYFRSRLGQSKQRGMSYWHDWVDWVGGYPFEVAKPEAIFDFFKGRGFVLARLKTVGGGLGCNEYVFHNAGAKDEQNP